jgi:perosamine synthetase
MIRERIRRYVAPAGAPVPIIHALRAAFRPGHNDTIAILAAYFGVQHIFGTCSGRAALWTILESLKKLRPERNLVAVPAYTCFSVAAAVVRAGLKIYPIDVIPETLELDYEELENVPSEDLLCILSANLFGFVNDLVRMEAIASAAGAFFVDDAAQALGASRNGKPAGMAGHAGFFSLARGKPLAAGEGGLIVSRCDQVAQALREQAARLPASSRVHNAGAFFRVLLSSLLLDPNLYWIPNSLPFLKLGATEYDPSFAITGMADVSRYLVGVLIGNLTELNRSRALKANTISRGIEESPKFCAPKPQPNCSPTFIRMPVLARDQGVRDRAVGALQRAGIGASKFYPTAICDIAEAKLHMVNGNPHREKAEEIARRLFTLPTHSLVRGEDITRMAVILAEI